MSANLYKPFPGNDSVEAWKEYARQLEWDVRELQASVTYEMTRHQVLVEVSRLSINEEIIREYEATNNNFILAIKRARYLLNLGLKEAKEYTENLLYAKE